MQLPKVGIRCNFFDLGGDSLMLEQLQSDVLERLGIQVPMAVLFQYPTIEQLAEYLDNQSQQADSVPQAKTPFGGQASSENGTDSGVGIAGASQESNDNASLKSKAERRREALSNKKRRAERG